MKNVQLLHRVDSGTKLIIAKKKYSKNISLYLNDVENTILIKLIGRKSQKYSNNLK